MITSKNFLFMQRIYRIQKIKPFMLHFYKQRQNPVFLIYNRLNLNANEIFIRLKQTND